MPASGIEEQHEPAPREPPPSRRLKTVALSGAALLFVAILIAAFQDSGRPHDDEADDITTDATPRVVREVHGR